MEVKCGRKYDARNHITYTCEATGCKNQRTTLKTQYYIANTHFCSKICAGANRRKSRRISEMKKSAVIGKTTKENIDKYFKEKQCLKR